MLFFSFSSPAYSQPRIEPRIVGGWETSTKQWPFLVSISSKHYSNTYKGHICSGSVIRPRVVLTAAHCVKQYKARFLRVVYKRSDLRTKQGREVDVTSKKVHPNYKRSNLSPDLALLKIKSPLQTPPVSISRRIPRDEVFSIAGWGWSGSGFSPILRETEMFQTDNQECQDLYGVAINFDTMFCAGGGGQGTCTGDSGSPLTIKRGRSATLYGITSWGEVRCKKFPGVYAKTDTSWVRSESKIMLASRQRSLEQSSFSNL